MFVLQGFFTLFVLVSIHRGISVHLAGSGWMLVALACWPPDAAGHSFDAYRWTSQKAPRDIRIQSQIYRNQQWLPQDPVSMAASGHKSIVNRLMANTHSIQISYSLSEGMGNLEAVFMDHSEECSLWAVVFRIAPVGQHALHTNFLFSQWGHGQPWSSLHGSFWRVFFVGCGLSSSSCWLLWFPTSSGSLLQRDVINDFSGHANSRNNITLTHALRGQRKDFILCVNLCRTGNCLENLLWKSEISVKLQTQDVLKCEDETHGMASWGPFSAPHPDPSPHLHPECSWGLLSHYKRGLAFSHCSFRVNFRPLALKESMTHQFHCMWFDWDNLNFQVCFYVWCQFKTC